MHYYFSLALALIFTSTTPSFASTTPNIDRNMGANPLKISLNCRGNPECFFENDDMIIDFVVTNNTDHDIGLPLTHMRKKGLHCFVVDNKTKRKVTLRISLTSASVKREFVKVGAGESVTVSRKISVDLIKDFQQDEVDLTVNLGITGLMQMREDEEPVIFLEQSEINIRGRKKFDLDSNK